MKNKFKFIALAVLSICVSACVDVYESFVPAEIGNEVVFGANAFFNNGNIKNTRTEYGQVSGNKIALNWVKGDQIEIYSATSQNKSAIYEVVPGNKGFEGTESSGNSTSGTLNRITEGGGIQWSAGVNNFYAAYPSSDKFSASTDDGSLTLTEGRITGNMPVKQNLRAVQDTKVANRYVLKPDMRYAFMAAKQSVDMNKGNADARVALTFQPLVTAIQFEITANTIGYQNATKNREIELTTLSLYSKTKNLAGDFEYDFNTGKITNKTQGTSSNRITLNIIDKQVLKKGDKLDVTFFLLSTEADDLLKAFPAGDLKVDIFFNVNNTSQVRTATIGVDLNARYKYYFKNFLLPEIKGNVAGSSWFSALEPSIYLRSVSFPCAGNAFSNLSKSPFTTEQVLDYQQLWNEGVRGFEFVTQSSKTSNSLGGEHFVCGEQILDGSNGTATSPTFQTAFANLTKYIIDNEKYPEYKNECLILLMRYHAVNDPYNPQNYVTHLVNFLKNSGVPQDKFVKLTANAKVADLRGKIAVIVRPGDDAYWKWIDSNASTSKITLGGWENNILVVHNWGSAYDRWDMRYGDAYTREATWGDATNDKKLKIEDYLWASSSDSTSFKTLRNYKAEAWPTENLRFAHTTSDPNIIAYIQEWARVSDEGLSISKGNGIYAHQYKTQWDFWEVRNVDYCMWVRWPESVSQKKRAIDKLFRQSVERNQRGLYLNVLSGYYITSKRKESLWPYQQSFDLSGATVKPSGQGNGGAFADLAADLNSYLYDIIGRNTALSDGSGNLPVGPLGMVFMDFIGATSAQMTQFSTGEFGIDVNKAATASQHLPKMIYMHNFSIDMEKDANYKDPNNAGGDSAGTGGTGGGGITE